MDSESSTESQLWSGEACDCKNSFIKFDCSVLRYPPTESPADCLHMKFKMIQSNSKLLTEIFNTHGLRQVDNSNPDYNIVWSGIYSMPEILRPMTPTQKINRFPRSYELTRKDHLSRNVDKMRQIKGSKHFNILPETFLLPDDYKDLCTAHNKNRGPWIVKPVSSSMGRRIRIVKHPSEISLKEPLIAARYIENPLLIDGHKCDLRLYVVVTSFDPLLIYVYEEGLVRFAALKYDASGGTFWNPCVHLCNYSVNKHHPDFVENEDCKADSRGHKWSMSAWLRHLRSNGVDTSILMQKIEDVIIKAILASAPPIVSAIKKFVPYPQNCFELYGFDILVDNDLKPWLLEVNFSPSLDSNTPLDMRVKSALLVDCLNLVGLPSVDPILRKRNRPSSVSAQVFHKMAAGERSRSSLTLDNSKSFTRQVTRMARRAKTEYERRGGFVRIFPTAESWKRYEMFLDPITGITSSCTMLGEVVDKKQNNNLLLHRELFPGSSTSSIDRLDLYERVLDSGLKINFEKNPDFQTLTDLTNNTNTIIRHIYDGRRLSQWQARRVFSRLLGLVTQPLSKKDKRPMGTHGDIIIDFLHKTSKCLKNPYDIDIPNSELKDKDKEAVISKTIHDFLSTYSRETELHTSKDDEGPKFVNNKCFQQFISAASENDLEKVLTLHSVLYNRVYLHLGRCGPAITGGMKAHLTSGQAIPKLSSILRKTTQSKR